jgi:hypothetical protein
MCGLDIEEKYKITEDQIRYGNRSTPNIRATVLQKAD